MRAARILGLVAVLALGCGGKSTRSAASEPAALAVVARAPGLGVDATEAALTRPVEDALAAIPGVTALRATTGAGEATIVATVADEARLDPALEAARAGLAALQRRLPPTAEPLVIVRGDPEAPPARVVAIRGAWPAFELIALADEKLAPRLERLAGVGAVALAGGQRRVVEIAVDPAHLAATGVTLPDLATALEAPVDLPAGRIATGARDVTVRSTGPRASIEDLEARVVGAVGGAPVRIRDVAIVAETVTPSGAGPIALAIQFQRGADRARVEATIDAELAALRRELPAGVELTSDAAPARPVAIALTGPVRAELERLARRVGRELGAPPPPARPELEVEIDRARAAALGISAATIASVLAIAGGRPLGRTARGADLVVRVEDLRELEVPASGGARVPLTRVVTLRERPGGTRLRLDRAPAIAWTVPLPIEELRRRIAALALPAGYRAAILRR